MIGLDIGEKSIKIVEVTEDSILSRYQISDILPRPEESLSQTITRTIIEAFRELGIEEKEVFTSLNGSKVMTRRITLPPMPEDEIKNAVYWEAKNFITFPIEDAVVDYYLLGETVSKGAHMLEVIAIAVQSQTLKELVAIIERANLKCAGVTINPLPLYELIKTKLDVPKDEAVALIDIGQKSTGLSLFKNHILQFTRDIYIGGSDITDNLASALKIETPAAQGIKNKYGLPGAQQSDQTNEPFTPGEIKTAMIGSFGGLLKEFISSFDYYRNQYFEEKIRQIYLCGGSSVTMNLPEYLMENMLIKVETVDPLLNLTIAPEIDQNKLKEAAPRLALAIGLALNQCRETNLVKVKESKKISLPQIKFAKILETLSLPTALVVGFPILVIALMVGINLYYNYSLDSAKREIDNATILMDRVTKLQERQTILSIIEKREIKVQEILKQLVAILPADTTLTSLSYENEKRKMEITGEVPDAKVASQLLNRIEDSPYFSDTRLQEIKKMGDATFFRMTFTVE